MAEASNTLIFKKELHEFFSFKSFYYVLEKSILGKTVGARK